MDRITDGIHENTCAVMMNSTTNYDSVYDSVMSKMSEQIKTGGLTATIQTNADSAGLALLSDVAVACGDLEIISFTETNSSVSISANSDSDSYVRSCKCDGAQSFTCNTDTLFPNEELLLCIWSTSQFLQSGVLDSMVSIFMGSCSEPLLLYIRVVVFLANFNVGSVMCRS